jgi:8-oxo-dGTP diphosphatase
MNKVELANREREIREQGNIDNIEHFSTGIAVVDKGKVLMIRREPNDFLGGNWEIPGGGIDDGETFIEGLNRELKEETGLEIENIISLFEGFDYINDKHAVKQVNFLVTTKTLDITLSHEHDDYLWVGLNDIDNITMTNEMKKCVRSAINITTKDS